MSSYDTNKQNSRMVTGLFPDRASAERAYNHLRPAAIPRTTST
jgi:hypothetical protein